MVDTADLGVPRSPKTSGVSTMLTPPIPLISTAHQPLNNRRETVDTTCAPLTHPAVLLTQPPDIPDTAEPASLPMKHEPTGSANKFSNKLGHASPQPVAGVERGLGHQSIPLNTCSKSKNKSKKKGR